MEEDEGVVIEPRRIPEDPLLDHPIILVLFEPYMDVLGKELNLKKSSLQRIRFPSMNYACTRIDGRKISLCGTPLGAPHAALILERLIVMGATQIVVFGCCGSLQPGLSFGHLVIPTGALSEEGTSVHYPLPKGAAMRADEKITHLCLEKSRDKKFPAVSGKVWTTDALFRETRSKVKKYASMGLLAVEMEMSALFTVAAFRQIQLGGLLVVSDELATLRWKTGFLNPFFWLNSKKAARLAIEVGLSL